MPNDRENTLSVIIITKDEERNIRECLESVTWTDEIIIVDSHSTDETVQLCKKYTDKIHIRDWPGYASQKNYGIEQATCEWILILDSDERISQELRLEIQETLTKTCNNSAYEIPFKNFIGDFWIRHGGLYPDYHCRLFRRNFAKYGQREIHEELLVEGQIGRLKEAILHKTYTNIADYVNKVNLYTTKEAEHYSSINATPHWGLHKFTLRFFKLYIRKKGYKDGFIGLTSALLLSLYPFLTYAKVKEIKRAKNT